MPTENASRIHTRASDGFEGVEGIPDVENIITNKELHVRETARAGEAGLPVTLPALLKG